MNGSASQTKPCAITATRLLWLRCLVKSGELPRAKMPGRVNGLGAVTSATWRPMVDAGLITARFGTRHFSQPNDWLFAITDAGRVLFSKLVGSNA